MWDMENVLITPHCGGGFRFPAVLDKIVEIAAENLMRYEEGQRLNNLVNRSTGYADIKK